MTSMAVEGDVMVPVGSLTGWRLRRLARRPGQLGYAGVEPFGAGSAYKRLVERARILDKMSMTCLEPNLGNACQDDIRHWGMI